MTVLPNPFMSDLEELFEISGEPPQAPRGAKAVEEPSRFVLDEAAFLEACEEWPLFLRRRA